MKQQHKKVFVMILSVVTVLLMANSIFSITVYKRALDENLYKEALEQSQIYTIVADIIERKITESFIEWEKNLISNLVPEDALQNNPLARTALSFVVGTLVEQQTPAFVGNAFDKIGLENVFRSFAEGTIDRDIAWLKGEREAHEAFGYIPTPEQIEDIKDSNFTEMINAMVQSSLGTNELPQCRNNTEIADSLNKIASGNVKDVTCTSDRIAPLLEDEVSNLGVVKVVDVIGEKADEIAQESHVNGFLSDIYNLSFAIAQIKEIALDIRSDVQNSLKWMYFTLFLSILSFGGALSLHKKGRRVYKGIMLFFVSGGLITFLSIMHYTVFSQLLLRAIPFERVAFGTSILTNVESATLVNSIQFIVEYIVTRLVSLSFVIGLWMMIIAAIMLGVYQVIVQRDLIKKYVVNMKEKYKK